MPSVPELFSSIKTTIAAISSIRLLSPMHYYIYCNNRLLLRLDMPVQIEIRDWSIQEGTDYYEYMFIVRCVMYAVQQFIFP